MKTCKLCGLEKPFINFYKRDTSKDGYRHQCIECLSEQKRLNYLRNPEPHRERANNWRKNNPEKRLINNRRWSALNKDKENISRKNWESKHPEYAAIKKHRRRAREYGVPRFSISETFIQDLYSSACIVCGSRYKVEADHIIPLSRGGEHSEANLQPLCKSCNSSKKDKTMTEWLSINERGNN